MTEHQILKTGTTTVGIMCKDGIVLAGDRRATAGYIVYKKARKVVPLSDNMAVTTAGNVSDIQLMVKLAKAEMMLKDFQTNRTSTVKEVANLLGGLLYSNIRRMSMIPGIAAFLLGGRDNSGFHVYSLDPDGSALEVDDYVADGSGSVFALGLLEAEYKKGINVEDGVKLAVKAVNSALQRDPASGNGIDVLTITSKGMQFVLEKEIDTRITV
ncbi:proteasome subunit beta [Candidatus Woesearchaeota archaeon]|nr:proteasome subunit beta [Candidatus Woesearchaeota archaeon]